MSIPTPNRRLLGTACALLALASLPVAAEEYRCTGRVGAVGLDNIFVPDGARCVLERTRAKGNIVVGEGASLYATSVSINGNLQAEGAADVQVGGNSTFGGSVQLVKGGSATIARARINGDILFDENHGLYLLGHRPGTQGRRRGRARGDAGTPEQVVAAGTRRRGAGAGVAALLIDGVATSTCRLLGLGIAASRMRRVHHAHRARLQVHRVVMVAAAVEHVADAQQHLDLPVRVGDMCGQSRGFEGPVARALQRRMAAP